jgi:hypothetical protein
MPITRKESNRSPINSTILSLASADDLNGTSDNTQAYDITGADRVVVYVHNNGTAGTAGIDVVEYSHDGGKTWASADDVLALTSHDAEGTFLVSGVLNAAGVEPTGIAFFKAGPFNGPTAIRVTRNVSINAASAAWVTGAPSVGAVVIGKGVSTLAALA